MVFTPFSKNQLFWKHKVLSEAGQLVRNCLIFGQNLRLSNRIAYEKMCILFQMKKKYDFSFFRPSSQNSEKNADSAWNKWFKNIFVWGFCGLLMSWEHLHLSGLSFHNRSILRIFSEWLFLSVIFSFLWTSSVDIWK